MQRFATLETFTVSLIKFNWLNQLRVNALYFAHVDTIPTEKWEKCLSGCNEKHYGISNGAHFQVCSFKGVWMKSKVAIYWSEYGHYIYTLSIISCILECCALFKILFVTVLWLIWGGDDVYRHGFLFSHIVVSSDYQHFSSSVRIVLCYKEDKKSERCDPDCAKEEVDKNTWETFRVNDNTEVR